MVRLVDSHCHLDRLDLAPFEGSLEKALLQAEACDVRTVLSISVDLESLPRILEIAERYPSVYASVGLHPLEEGGEEPTVQHLLRGAAHPKVIAIGETGLDYSYPTPSQAVQQKRFVTHIEASLQAKKPLIIHTRAAETDTLSLLRSHHVEAGVFHCFTGSLEMARAGLDLGLYISFSGILTFKNAAALREMAAYIPLDRLLVETDAPYLTPVPYRGKPNYPGHTRIVAECLAEIKGLSYPEIAHATTDNFKRLFQLETLNEAC